MERWEGRVALVTGASAGIGAAVCKDLVMAGMRVVGAARRVERIQSMAEELKCEKGKLLAVKCDLRKDDDVVHLFDVINTTFGGVDICINNAGLSTYKCLLDGTPDQWRLMTDVNIIALCHCTKLAVASMRERGVDDGHIININSIGGHYVVPIGEVRFYCGTKHAVRAITEGLRQELREAKSHIRATEISPGAVRTEFGEQMLQDSDLAEKMYEAFPPLTGEDLASMVRHVISLPPHVEVNDVIIRPVQQAM